MKITCIDKEVKKILETWYYCIPRFQRPYSWEKEHIDEFWNDTILWSETDYFIWSIVVYKQENDLFGIVDWQQRLTTITMLLCALRDRYMYEWFDLLAKGIHSLIERFDLDSNAKYILQTETSYPYFQEYIQKFNSPEIEILPSQEEEKLKYWFNQVKNFIVSKIEAVKNNRQLDQKTAIEKELNSIRDSILKLKVIYIELDNEDDAYLIFETLNTRWKDLSTGDLIKNFLAKNIKLTNKNVDITKEKWNQVKSNIENVMKDIDIDIFLLHYWLSKYEYTTWKALFKKFKKTILPKEASKFLDELTKDSDTYKVIFDPDTKKWNKNELPIRDSLVSLYWFNVTQQTPMILSIMREYNAKRIPFRYAKEAIESIEHFHYIFTAITSQRSSGWIASMYSQYARKLHDAKDEKLKLDVIRELKKKMIEKIPTFDEFLASFKTLEFTNQNTKQKKIIQYTLSKFDKTYNNSWASINYWLMTIEHILSQKMTKNSIKNDFIWKIGNLILINEETNSTKLKDKLFQDKKPILKGSSIFIDEVIDNATDWTESEINKRVELIAHLCFKEVFKI